MTGFLRMCRLTLLGLTLGAVIAPAYHSAAAEGRRVLIHLKTGITQDDNQMCVAFNIAQAAIEAGDQLELLFDAAAVSDLQNAPTLGESATSQPTLQPTGTDQRPYNLRYELPDKLKQILSQQFGTPIDELPTDYYGYLSSLHERGAEITFNGVMAHLVSLSNSVSGSESLAAIATPISLTAMIDHVARADVYFVY